MVNDPVTVNPDTTIGEIKALTAEHGFQGFPVIEKNGDLVGIVTGRDTRFEDDDSKPVKDVMSDKSRLVTVHETAQRMKSCS